MATCRPLGRWVLKISQNKVIMKDTVALLLLTAAFSIMLSSLDLGISKTIGISGVLAVFYMAILDIKYK